MKEQLSILQLNKRQYNVKHVNDSFVLAIDYNDKYQINQNIPMQLIYNSNTGLVSEVINVVCIAIAEKGIKKTKFMFRRRQNYSKKIGMKKLHTYVQVTLGSK